MADVKTFAMLAVCLLAAAIMIPIGMQQLIIATGTNVSGTTYDWNASVLTLWNVLLPILMIISVALFFIPHAEGGD